MYDTLISAAQLQALDDVLILDCRFVLSTRPEDQSAGEQAFADGHIPTARYLHLERDLSSSIGPKTGRHPLPDLAQLLAKLRSAGLRPERQVVVYDASGGAFAARAWWLIRWLGHRAVAVLNGGWPHWLAAGGAVESGAVESLQAISPAPVEVDAGMLVTAEQVQHALANRACLLVDARAAIRFRGEQEPLDPVAGHIPGAVNLPFDSLLTDGALHTPAQLRERWQALLGESQPEQVVHMCGSGVTACVNLLAMEAAGMSGSCLYAGSWSEWIRDPARPVARGGD